MERPGHFTQLPPSLRSHLGMRGTPEELGGAAPPGRSPETDGRQGPEQGRPSPRPPTTVWRSSDNRRVRAGWPRCEAALPPAGRAGQRPRGAFPSGRCPLPAPGIAGSLGTPRARPRPRPITPEGRGGGRGGPRRWAAEPTARSARTGSGRALSPLDLFPRPPSGDRHHLPGPLCRGGRDLSHPEKSLRLPHPGSFSWDRAVPRAQAWQAWGLEASASGLGPHLEEVGAVGRFQAGGPGGSALSCP